jgi:hypothetical protein
MRAHLMRRIKSLCSPKCLLLQTYPFFAACGQEVMSQGVRKVMRDILASLTGCPSSGFKAPVRLLR